MMMKELDRLTVTPAPMSMGPGPCFLAGFGRFEAG